MSTNNLFLYDATPFVSLVILTSFFNLLSTNLSLLFGRKLSMEEGLKKNTLSFYFQYKNDLFL